MNLTIKMISDAIDMKKIGDKNSFGDGHSHFSVFYNQNNNELELMEMYSGTDLKRDEQ